jgi:hypothetical protein
VSIYPAVCDSVRKAGRLEVQGPGVALTFYVLNVVWWWGGTTVGRGVVIDAPPSFLAVECIVYRRYERSSGFVVCAWCA